MSYEPMKEHKSNILIYLIYKKIKKLNWFSYIKSNTCGYRNIRINSYCKMILNRQKKTQRLAIIHICI